jgi:putative transposase
MPYDPSIHPRRSIRLPEYDYAQPGAYFVTICTRERECVLGDIVNGRMELNALGDIAHRFWSQVPAHFPGVIIDACATMPNHGDAIIVIADTIHPGADPVRGVVTTPAATRIATPDPPRAVVDAGRGRGTQPLRPPVLGQIVAFYKYQTTKTINQTLDMAGVRSWQRNYWEHVLRNKAELQRIREYIETNPGRWSDDRLYPAARTDR